MTSNAKLLYSFVHNSRMKAVVKPRIDLQCLTTDPDIGREMAAAVTDQLRQKLPHDDSVDKLETD